MVLYFGLADWDLGELHTTKITYGSQAQSRIYVVWPRLDNNEWSGTVVYDQTLADPQAQVVHVLLRENM